MINNQIESVFKRRGLHYLNTDNELCNPHNDSKINFMLPDASTYANDPTALILPMAGVNAFYSDIHKHHLSITTRSIRMCLDRLFLRLGYASVIHPVMGLHYADAVLVEHDGLIKIIDL